MQNQPYPAELQLARATLWKLAQLGGTHTQLAMRYIGLFAPINGKLEFEQIYQLLEDLTGIWHDCTAQEWQNACEKLLAEKISGSLKVPLQNHERLMELLDIYHDQQRQPENEAGLCKPQCPENETPPSAYPSNTRLTPKPEPPPYVPPTAEQKAQASVMLQAMKQICNRASKRQPNI